MSEVPVTARLGTHTPDMEKIQDWFGTPRKTVNTFVWVLWVFFLLNVLGLVVFLLFLGARAVIT